MGRRSRRREREAGAPEAGGPGSFADLGLDLDLGGTEDVPAATTAALTLPDELGTLTLRTSMSAGTRTEYAAVVRGDRSSPSAAREDAWHRRVEFLYERLVVGWEVAGVPTTGPKALLARLRAATGDERAAVRHALRAHLERHLPDLDAS